LPITFRSQPLRHCRRTGCRELKEIAQSPRELTRLPRVDQTFQPLTGAMVGVAEDPPVATELQLFQEERVLREQPWQIATGIIMRAIEGDEIRVRSGTNRRNIVDRASIALVAELVVANVAHRSGRAVTTAHAPLAAPLALGTQRRQEGGRAVDDIIRGIFGQKTDLRI